VSLPLQIAEKLSALGVRPGDIEERFVRGSGPGGQKINKTSSTVWLRHRSTGIEVRCQRERSQAVNRLVAWAEMAAKIEARQAGALAVQRQEREAARRRARQKPFSQKVRMIESKKRRAVNKAGRGRVDPGE
jgi:protein subunit release factor B